MYFSLGDSLNKHEKPKEAIKAYTQALELNPDFPLALNNLARIRATHPDAALREARQRGQLTLGRPRIRASHPDVA